MSPAARQLPVFGGTPNPAARRVCGLGRFRLRPPRSGRRGVCAKYLHKCPLHCEEGAGGLISCPSTLRTASKTNSTSALLPSQALLSPGILFQSSPRVPLLGRQNHHAGSPASGPAGPFQLMCYLRTRIKNLRTDCKNFTPTSLDPNNATLPLRFELLSSRLMQLNRMRKKSQRNT